LHKYRLSNEDWAILGDYEQILQVIQMVIYLDKMLIKYFQIPHAFQEMLSREKTPTLSYIIPSFASFILCWENLVEENPDWADIIQPGLDKLGDYEDRLTDTHLVAMGKLYLIYYL
jgi:hypothetical protein